MSNAVCIPFTPEQIPVVVSKSDFYKREDGAIRRGFVYEDLVSGLLSAPEVEDLYVEWVNDPEYYIMKKPVMFKQLNIDTNYEEICFKTIYKFIKASKRGNDVYRFLVKEKLAPLLNLDKKPIVDVNIRGHKKTNFLFVTLTYDADRCNWVEAWQQIGKEFNLFKSNLKKHYKCSVEVFRSWESTKLFYPHIHLIIGFTDKEFELFEHKDKYDKVKLRVCNKDRDIISGYWHSFVDIQGVDDSIGAVKELTKYITKELNTDKGHKTHAMIWAFRKQSYSISRGFLSLIDKNFIGGDVIKDVETNEFIKRTMCNSNYDNFKWEFCGIVRGKHLGFVSKFWCMTCVDPPPRVKDLVVMAELRNLEKVSKKRGVKCEI